jgi:hypothetical protein
MFVQVGFLYLIVTKHKLTVWRADPIPTRFLAPIDCSKIQAQTARLHSMAEWIPWNRFLGSLKV